MPSITGLTIGEFINMTNDQNKKDISYDLEEFMQWLHNMKGFRGLDFAQLSIKARMDLNEEWKRTKI